MHSFYKVDLVDPIKEDRDIFYRDAEAGRRLSPDIASIFIDDLCMNRARLEWNRKTGGRWSPSTDVEINATYHELRWYCIACGYRPEPISPARITDETDQI